MNKKVLVTAILFGSLTVSGIVSAQSVYPGQHQGKLKKETVAPLQAESFDLKDVRLLPSRFRDNMLRDSAWMTSIDVNRLLHSFRTNAGVFAGREGGYMTVKKLGGWESLDCELRGHTTGHMLSALGLMYAATGSEIFKLKGDSLVNGLEEVQNALKNGYLSAWPEELINKARSGTPSHHTAPHRPEEKNSRPLVTQIHTVAKLRPKQDPRSALSATSLSSNPPSNRLFDRQQPA